MKRLSSPLVGLFALLLTLFITGETFAASKALDFSPEVQSPDLFYNEALTVYYGNLQRRANGVPPLSWNRELTLSARWFAWDSVENRPDGYCGHQDTWGLWPGSRNSRYGYLGFGGAENAYCGYMQPQDAINGWMNSPGHRANLLDPNSQEIGMGYYRRASDGRGYLVQDFGVDSTYPPLVISDELPGTTSQQVSLYQYSPKSDGGLTGMGPAAQMMFSNTPCFSGAAWQPYQPESAWTLTPGSGWKTVYSKIRDNLGRSSTASDTIYLGGNYPTAELNLSRLTQTRPSVTLNGLNAGYTGAQFSLGWMMNDSKFEFLWGAGSPVADANSSGGTTYRLNLSNMESSAWAYTTDFIYDTPMVAYVRMRASSSTEPGEVARFQVETNEVPQSISIRGTDFAAPNQYQEFAVPFIFHKNDAKPFLIFQVWRTSSAVIDVDHVTVFTATQPLSGSSFTWNVPGGHYRGQTVWVRYVSGSAFTGYQEAQTAAGLSAAPQQLAYLALTGKSSSHFQIQVNCCGGWSVDSAPAWLKYSISGSGLDTYANAASMSMGAYQSNLVLTTNDGSTSVTIPVKLVVVDTLYPVFAPGVER